MAKGPANKTADFCKSVLLWNAWSNSPSFKLLDSLLIWVLEISISPKKEFIDQKNYFNSFKKLPNKYLEEKYSYLIDEKMHTLELANWIEYLRE